jgi:HlyD family secretion protein
MEEIRQGATTCPHCRNNLVPLQNIADKQLGFEARLTALEQEVTALRNPNAGDATTEETTSAAPMEFADRSTTPDIGWPHMADNIFSSVWYWWPGPLGEAAPPFVGMVRTTEIRIAPEVGGRLARFLVGPGQVVHRGEAVAVLNIPELLAAVGVAHAQVDKARSDRDRVYAGVREKQVQMLEREIQKAQAIHTQATEELARKRVLAARSDSSLQDLDNAKTAEARDLAEIAAAEARYAEAQRGPTEEERALADVTVAAAEAARDVVEMRAAKMLLRAPDSGVIAIMAAEVGEAVVPGEPVLTMVPDHGIWFGFNIREDALAGLTIGSVVAIRVSGGTQPITAQVTEMRNRGEFATWRAARATGDHDLNTFFVRLDPTVEALRLTAGETVLMNPEDK